MRESDIFQQQSNHKNTCNVKKLRKYKITESIFELQITTSTHTFTIMSTKSKYYEYYDYYEHVKREITKISSLIDPLS